MRQLAAAKKAKRLVDFSDTKARVASSVGHGVGWDWEGKLRGRKGKERRKWLYGRYVRCKRCIGDGDGESSVLPLVSIYLCSLTPLPDWIGVIRVRSSDAYASSLPKREKGTRREEREMDDNLKGFLLALLSSGFIGASFIIKKKGLRRAAAASGVRAGLPPSLSLSHQHLLPLRSICF
ncbi:hypothetical protein ACLOJK_024710 [Asimina triloba]